MGGQNRWSSALREEIQRSRVKCREIGQHNFFADEKVFAPMSRFLVEKRRRGG
jgi:hypothetical protein